MGDLIHGIRWRLTNSENSETIDKGLFRLSDKLIRALLDAHFNFIYEGKLEDVDAKEAELRRLFPHRTGSYWLDYWLDSPLRSEQCVFLEPVIGKVEPQDTEDYNYGSWSRFHSAFHAARDGAFMLHVDLSPPGHADLGWITIFDHCPRCKEHSPTWSWQDRNAPINCPTCGFVYVPEGTGSSKEWSLPRIDKEAENKATPKPIKKPDWKTTSATLWESPDIQEALTMWLGAIRQLYADITQWSSEEGWTITRIPQHYIERTVGPYSSVKLVIRIARGKNVTFSIRERGDLEHSGQLELRGHHQVFLERNEKNGGWLVITKDGLRLRYPWNRVTFIHLIQDLLESKDD